MNEAMITRAQALVDKKEVEYHHTDGNTHIFIGQGHSGREDKQYEIKAVIEQNNEIEWYVIVFMLSIMMSVSID